MPSVAIIGASSDRSKFGNKAVRAYRKRGWVVYPVNPKEAAIEELTAYKSITDVPRPLDRVAMYLPPQAGLTIIADIAVVQADELYFNPGSESPELLDKAKELGLSPILACSILDIGLSPAQFE